jgi:hypothetical protein
MASEPERPLLRLRPTPEKERKKKSNSGGPRPPEPFPKDQQTRAFSPKFDRLAEVLARDPSGLELAADPTGFAPERLMVFEVRGSISAFANAVQKVPGLELIDEEELAGDTEDKEPVAYLMVPDERALRELESLWKRWERDDLGWGETPWRDVFQRLRDLRPWGPGDRVQRETQTILEEEISGRDPTDLIPLEIELVFRREPQDAAAGRKKVAAVVTNAGGRVVSEARLEDIAYDALLVNIPVSAVQGILAKQADSIAGMMPVMHIRPQSLVTSLDVADLGEAERRPQPGELADPILAVLDGVPVAAHPLLADHLDVDDLFDLEPNTPVADRRHGTAMASLVVHGDLNRPEAPLPRRIAMIPVLGPQDEFPKDRLIVDLIYTAVRRMREVPEATAPHVLIVNLSLGDKRRPFQGRLSAFARLLDRLAYHFGLLFFVSAGNHDGKFGIPSFANGTQYEDAGEEARANGTLQALGNIMADRRVLSPGETVNGLTVGALNEDAVAPMMRKAASSIVDPYRNLTMSNPSSALGPGFANATKPDVLMPGAREHLSFQGNNPHVFVRPAGVGRMAGLKVAAPPRDGLENSDGYTGGTSAAAALASRTAHRIHDALEAAYGDDFLSLAHLQRAVLLKALLAHTARWPEDAASLIRTVLGPANPRQSVRRKDNIRRFLGFGAVDADAAVTCAADRATFWATGTLTPEKAVVVPVPVPVAYGGQARPHSLSATLAWFTPTAPGRKSYRTVRLQVLEPKEIHPLALTGDRLQPDLNQARRGTLFNRTWTGDKAPAVGPDMTIPLTVQRTPDQSTKVDDPIPFGLAVTLAMPGVMEIYDQVRQRLEIADRARA